MNIVNFLYHAGFLDDNGGWDERPSSEQQDNFQRFSHLIVKECINLARSEEDRFYGLDESDFALCMENFQELLKHHFDIQ